MLFTNKFARMFNEKARAAALQRYREKFEPKPYLVEYRPLYLAAVAFGFLCNALTGAAGAYALYKLFTPALPLWAGVLVAVVLAASVEALKRATAERVAVSYLRESALSALAAVSVVLIALSTYAAYWGAETAIVEAHGSAPVERSDSLTAHHIATIAAAREAIAAASTQKRADGSLPASARRQIERAQKQIERAQQRIDAIERATDARNARIEQTHTATATGRGTAFGLVALFAEIALICCIFYANYYQHRALVEALGGGGGGEKQQQQTARAFSVPPQQAPNGAHESGSARRPIGFHRQGVCRRCGGEFAARTTWQVYCSEACRVQAWEERTGKALLKSNKA